MILQNQMKNSQNGFVIPLLVALVAVIAIGGGFYYSKNIKKAEIIYPINATSTIVGNDRDAHGCIGSAGYSWCEIKNKCLRTWEEKCEATPAVATTSLPTSCVDQLEAKAVVTSLSNYSGPVGTNIEIKGCNFSGFEGDKYAWIENTQGVKGILYGEQDSNAKVIKVVLKNLLCSQDNSYSGLPCKSYLTLTPGLYKIWTTPWGAETKSNIVSFTITETTFTATPVSGPAPLTVQFSKTIQSAGDISIDYGDEQSCSTADPSGLTDCNLYVHTYKIPGTYTAILYRHLPTTELARVTVSVLGVNTCTPNWTCGWAPCTNGYQGMTAIDSNSCGLTSTGVQIACPALARQCSN